jgi:hypothetical protein
MKNILNIKKQKENAQEEKAKNKAGAKVTHAFMLHVLISRPSEQPLVH